jgi:hypothetical protein
MVPRNEVGGASGAKGRIEAPAPGLFRSLDTAAFRRSRFSLVNSTAFLLSWKSLHKWLIIIQSLEIPFTGRQIEPGVYLATEQGSFPWTHAKETFCYCADRIGLPV